MPKPPIGANRLLHVFGREIVECEESISDAFNSLSIAVAHSPAPARLVHTAIRRVLSDSALISLIFFPAKGSGRASQLAETRAAFLRAELHVDNTSLLKSRTVRNHI
ncbi:MAG: hypothetical protein Q8O82_02485, partial [Pseudorhodobacter sp.]|nr:hypothetical protein [Pseudorhodobacter sp.]